MRPSVKVLLALCAIAALVPLLGAHSQAVVDGSFPGWPGTLDGKPLRALPLGAVEKRFAADFPGHIGRFTDGEREIVIRWVSEETRKLHPASDCFRGVGYRISPQPLYYDSAGARWGVFEAERGAERLRVQERIYDASGQQWTDVSAWYWAAATDATTGPWWAITTAARSPQSPGG